MSDIFISYASVDRQQAETLAQGLKAQGWTVWWDRTIPTGRTFDEVIEEALDAAKGVIVLWSEKSVKSSWVRTECRREGYWNILIPVLIEKVRIPLAFCRIQAANLIGWDGSYTESSFQELLGHIAALLGHPPKAEEKQQQAVAEAKRKAEEKRQQAEAEAKRKAEEKQQQAEAEAKRKAEEKRQQAKAEVKRKAEEERKRAEAEAKRKAEEKRQQAETEAKHKAEEKRQQAEAKANRKAEEKRQQAEAEAKRKDVRASEEIEVIPTSEPIPDELDQPKPTGRETEEAPSKRRTARVRIAVSIFGLMALFSAPFWVEYFRPKSWILGIVDVDNGSVIKSPSNPLYEDGEVVILEAVPSTGYSFANWSGDLSGSTNPATLVMDADKWVTASFALKTSSLTASFDFKAGKVVTNSIDMKLVYIPAGSFMMGSSSSAKLLASEYDTKEVYFTDEFPQHQVRISEGFWMGQTEVIQGQYKSVMNAQPWSGEDYVQESANNPAVYVNWDDAAAFCRKLSQQEGKTYRLPTEAEWEYACRAGTTTRFSFGDSDSSLGDYAWCASNASEVGQDYPHSVGQKKPNPWGLYDMHGNVWEMCSDWYDEDYYSNSPSVDPKGPSRGSSKFPRKSSRGGSWAHFEGSLRCSGRGSRNPFDRGSSAGFRVVRSQP